MQNKPKVSTKEIVFRQWFASKYGNKFENFEQYNLPNTIANLDREYQQDLGAKMSVSFNFSMDKLRKIQDEIRAEGAFDLFIEDYNAGLIDIEIIDEKIDAAVMPSLNGSPGVIDVPVPVEVEFIVEDIDKMEFPEFRLHKTGHIIDRIMSDYEEDGGLYGGTVIITTGESGVGKSTLLIDYLAKLKEYKREAILASEEYLAIEDAGEQAKYIEENSFRPLYISTEMTKNDIFFYKAKMPQIGQVPTLLAMNYIKGGLKEVITKAFNSDYDVILLDSYQDLVEKLKDVMSWKANYAENFLITLMTEAAEKKGVAILAIQHLTKGGEYVGRTFLKHVTTAMFELRFDSSGRRYAMFSKNRRGGSMTHKPLYFMLDKKTGVLSYDAETFEDNEKAVEMAEDERDDRKDIDNKFDNIFTVINKAKNKDGEEDTNLTPDNEDTNFEDRDFTDSENDGEIKF